MCLDAMQAGRAALGGAIPMKTLLLVGIALLLATAATPVASADQIDCGEDSILNQAQRCANAVADYGQRVVYDLYCDLACPS